MKMAMQLVVFGIGLAVYVAAIEVGSTFVSSLLFGMGWMAFSGLVVGRYHA